MKAQLALAAVLVGACVFPANAETRKDFRTSDAPPMPLRGVCAHRGNGGGKPENTVVAFTNAVALGAAMVEFDVKRCKTGELVIMHDATVDRTTNGKGAVKDLTFDEIRRLSVKWPGHPDANVKVPTFDEAIDCLPVEGVWINCHSAGNAAVEVARKIKAKGRLHQAFVASPLPAIAEARKAVPDILACNMSRTVKGLDAYLKPWPPEKSTLYAKQTMENKCQFLQLLHPCSRADVEMMHAAGVKVSYFKCDDPEKAKELLALGVDFVLTDRIEAIRPVWCGTMSSARARGTPTTRLRSGRRSPPYVQRPCRAARDCRAGDSMVQYRHEKFGYMRQKVVYRACGGGVRRVCDGQECGRDGVRPSQVR